MNEDWPKDKKPTPSPPLSDEAEDWINAEIDVAVAEIEERIGPHPATKEYQVCLLENNNASR